MNKNDQINRHHARSEHQQGVMDQIEKDNVCPFCMENLAKYHKNPILKEGEFWVVTDSQWPYKNTKHHLLAISRTHVEHINELPKGAGEELMNLFAEVTKERSIPGGGLCIRFGWNPEHGDYGSSVRHIHAHLIEPDLTQGEKVKFKIGHPKHLKE